MAPVPYTLDQIRAALQTQWGGNNNGTTRWWRETDRTIEYSLPSTVPTRADGEQTGFRAMTSTESSYARLAFELWDDLIAWDLNEVNNTDAQITMAMSSSTRGGGTYATPFLVAQPPGSSTFERDIERERIWLNTGWQDFQNGNFDYGERGLETMLHEIGHTLGLSHPGPYNATDVPAPTYADDALYTQDTLQWTIMSYWAAGADGTAVDRTGGARTLDGNGDGVNAATPLLHDIMAIQAKYGADMTTRAGNDTYGFNASFSGPWRPVFDFGWLYNEDPVIAIWDAGGYDTLDVSGFTQNQRIDLAPGTISDIGALTQNVAIAFGAIIESAKGGTGSDRIRGNHVDNYLFGGAGVDTIEGFDGHDTLDQWHDGGWMYGGNGQDTLWSGNGGDHMDGGDGLDRAVFSRSPAAITIDTTTGKVFGGDAQGDTLVNIEEIVASAHNDFIRMGGGDNAIWAGNGQDEVDGGSGGDRLFGEGGNDVLLGGHGRWVGDLFYIGDEINGGDGVDTAVFNSAVTIDLRPGGVHGGEALEDIFISIERFRGSAERDFFYGSNFNDWFQGRGEGDYMNGGGGNDTASYAERTSGITADMTFNNMAVGDEARHPNEIAGRTDGKVSPHEGTWIDTLISMENIEGTNFDDVFLGDERANTFWGLGGADRFEGDSGSTPQGSWDDMFGGSGNDTFVVGPNDYADGGPDNDAATFVGGALFLDFPNFISRIGSTAIHVQNIETYIGTDLSDTVHGANHGETINLGAGGQDFANGNGGNDFLVTSDGFDTLIGGADFDTIVFHRSMMASWQTGELDPAIAETWQSWEAIQGASGVDVIRTNSWGFAVELRGGAGNDVLATGVTGVIGDTLRGEAGNDTLNGGAGADLMEGGADNDTYFVDSVFDKVVEAANQGNDTVVTSTSFVLSGASSIETVQTTSSAAATAINLVGNAYANRLFGNAAGNSLNGAGGADQLRGFAGNDLYLVDNAGDAIVEIAGQGIDTVMSSTSYSLAAGVSVEILKTTSAVATTVLSLSGNELVNTLEGNAGANALNGRGGADTMRGFSGNDIYYVDNALDNVIEGGGQGSDTIWTTVSYVMGSGAVVEALRAASPAATTAINLVGNAIANTLVGNDGNNILIGGAGNDTMHGLGGDDAYVVDSTADKIVEAAGKGTDNVSTSISYQLGTGVSVETLRTVNAAATTAINLAGNAFANAVIGNAGSNMLYGYAGKDSLTGGGGNDFFVFNTALNAVSNVDSILDFNVAQDTIRLENGIFTALGAGPFTAGMFNTGAAATQADDRIVYNGTTGALIYDSNGNAAGGAVQFATLSKNLPLTHADFQII